MKRKNKNKKHILKEKYVNELLDNRNYLEDAKEKRSVYYDLIKNCRKWKGIL